MPVAQLRELRQLFDAFDGDGDGLLQADEVGAILQSCGVVMSEPEVLDLITEVEPNLRQLPFDEFRALMCSQLPGTRAYEDEVREVFASFAGPDETVTPTSLRAAMEALGHPVSKLVVRPSI